MKNLTILFLYLFAFCVNAQQTISDWKHEKESSSNPRYFIRAGKKVYFLASSNARSQELWITEGTPETTRKVRDIGGDRNNAANSLVQQPGIEQSFNLESPPPLSFFNNSAALDNGVLYFVNSENPNEKPKIWVTDGTEQGTKIYREEVKGTLFHTGDELVEYVIDGRKGMFSILHSDSKRDSNFVIEKGYYYSASVVNGNVLRLSNYENHAPTYFALIDLKEQKIKNRILPLPLVNDSNGDYITSIVWNNELYFTRRFFDSKKVYVAKLNNINDKIDTLAVLIPKKDSYISTYLFPTSKEILVFTNDSLYTIKNNKLIVKNNPNFKNILQYRSLLYDEKNDEIYAFENDDSKKRLLVKSINMSTGDLIKDYSIPTVEFYVHISGTKIWVKDYYSYPRKLSILDVQTQKLIAFPYVLNSIIKQEDKTIFSGYSAIPKINAELYILDNQTNEVKLVKDINSNGYLKSTVYTNTFGGKLVQVYNNEKGVMLAVSDGTKSGTKDVKLLIRNFNLTAISQVLFQEVNQRLGLLISTKNGVDYKNDSIFLFSVGKTLNDVQPLTRSQGRSFIYDFSKAFSKVDSSSNFLELNIVSDYPSSFYQTILTDLTLENTVLLGSIVRIFKISDKNIIINYNPNLNSNFPNSYLARYDLATHKISPIPNTQNCSLVYIFEGKIYYYLKKIDRYFVSDGYTFTSLGELKNIQDFIKIDNALFVGESAVISYFSENNVYYKSIKYAIWQIDNDIPNQKITFNATFPSNTNVSSKLWKINGKSFLILNIPNKNLDENFQTLFYEISKDFSLKKVFQIDERHRNYYGSSIQFLSKGITFSQKTVNQTIVYVMNDSFVPKELFRLNQKEIYNDETVFSSKSKRFFFISNGSLLVTDGSETGSKFLINNNLQDSYPEKFVKITQKLNTDGSKFYFTFSSTNLYGKNLWITDGTQEGTIQLLNTKDSLINNYSYTVDGSLGLIGNKYIFKKLNKFSGKYEVWTTEGTIETTKKLKDFQGNEVTRSLNVGGYYQDFNYNLKQWESLPKIDNKLYFSKFNTETGFEPWQTDGTPEGTKMLGDLVKGFQSSDPFQFVEINQNPYCIAIETNKALQLWAFCDLKTSILAENNLPINSEEVKLISTQNNDWKYQWFWNGSPIEKANLMTFKAQYSGTFQVKVEDKIGCTNVSDSVVIKFAQSILANEPYTNDFALKIYPNPTQNNLNITFEGKSQEYFEVTVYDLLGRIMSNQAVESNVNNTISIKQLNAGMYFLRLSNGKKQMIQKIVKE